MTKGIPALNWLCWEVQVTGGQGSSPYICAVGHVVEAGGSKA